MELKIIQTNDNGMFGGTYLNDFEYVYNNTNYRVKIEQYIKRERFCLFKVKEAQC